MADVKTKASGYGATLLAAAALLGAVVAVYNYNSPTSGINATAGDLLVIFSSAILFLLGIAVDRARLGGRLLRGFIYTASLLDIAGTMFAAYLLESTPLLALMLVCLVGWLVAVLGPRRMSA
jgi:hypothetical protein